MGNLTDRAMRDIGKLVLKISDEKRLFYQVNMVIVTTSHDIDDRPGDDGHRIRQHIRKRLWKEAKSRYCILRKYILPDDIAGDSPYQIRKRSFIQRSRCRLKMFFQKITRIFHGSG